MIRNRTQQTKGSNSFDVNLTSQLIVVQFAFVQTKVLTLLNLYNVKREKKSHYIFHTKNIIKTQSFSPKNSTYTICDSEHYSLKSINIFASLIVQDGEVLK